MQTALTRSLLLDILTDREQTLDPDTYEQLRAAVDTMDGRVVHELTDADVISHADNISVYPGEIRFAEKAATMLHAVAVEGHATAQARVRCVLRTLEDVDPAVPVYVLVSPAAGVLFLGANGDARGKLPGHDSLNPGAYTQAVDALLLPLLEREATALLPPILLADVAAGDTIQITDGEGQSVVFEYVLPSGTPTNPEAYALTLDPTHTQGQRNEALLTALQGAAIPAGIPTIEYDDATGFTFTHLPGAAGNAATVDVTLASGNPPDGVIPFTGGRDESEHLAVAMTGNLVSFYSWPDLEYVTSYGGAAGDGPGELDAPTALAYDQETDTLYVACLGETVDPLAPGFIKALDAGTLDGGTPPVEESVIMTCSQTARVRLVDQSCARPRALAFDLDQAALWIIADNVVGPDAPTDVAAFLVEGDAPAGTASLRLVRYLEPQSTRGYVLRYARDLAIGDFSEIKQVYVASQHTGSIDVFDADSQEHLGYLGIRTVDDYTEGRITADPARYPVTLPEVGEPVSVAAGPDNHVLTVDARNGRMILLDEPAVRGETIINYRQRETGKPVQLLGWSVDGTVSRAHLTVSYRPSPDVEFRPLDGPTRPLTEYQIRLEFCAPRVTLLSEFTLRRLYVHAQAV